MNHSLLTRRGSAWAAGALLLVAGRMVLAQPGVKIEPAAIPTVEFPKLHALIKPQPGELRFHEIPWLIDVWEARRQAAKVGKPILAWSGAGGAPIGVC